MGFSAPFRAPIQAPMFSAGAVNPLASAPWVAQWKFNNNGNDSIGSNTLTAVNSPTFTAGKIGGATGATQLVRASSQYWLSNSNAALQTGEVDFTVCAWVYFDSFTSILSAIVSKLDAGQYEYTLDCSSSGIVGFTVIKQDVSTFVTCNATNFGALSLSTWYCVFGWYDSGASTANVSVNNVSETPANAASVTLTAGTGALTIGARADSLPTYLFDGRIDNVCIAKSAAGGGGVLSAAQRTAFYNAGNGTETLT